MHAQCVVFYDKIILNYYVHGYVGHLMLLMYVGHASDYTDNHASFVIIHNAACMHASLVLVVKALANTNENHAAETAQLTTWTKTYFARFTL